MMLPIAMGERISTNRKSSKNHKVFKAFIVNNIDAENRK